MSHSNSISIPFTSFQFINNLLKYVKEFISAHSKLYFFLNQDKSILCDIFKQVFGAEWIKFLAKNHFETFEVNGLLFRHDPVLLSDTCTVAVNNNGKFEVFHASLQIEMLYLFIGCFSVWCKQIEYHQGTRGWFNEMTFLSLKKLQAVPFFNPPPSLCLDEIIFNFI